MNVFVDCGASDGGTVRLFGNLYPCADGFEVHAFEPNPIWPEIAGAYFHRQAVWIRDGRANLYRGDPESATLMRNKRTGHIDYSEPLIVETIDFSKWLERYPLRSVVVKMDIEGAEYDVLSRLLVTGMLSRIRELHIDWHWNKIGLSSETQDYYVARIQAAGIALYDLSRSKPAFLEAYP